MSAAQVQVVLINWRRVNNVAKIVTALKKQSVPCKILVADCAPGEGCLTDAVGKHVDGIVRVRENLGPPSRFIPALAYDLAPYTYFHDDDALPGPKCLEAYLRAADALEGSFAVLGQIGRRFLDRGGPADKLYRTGYDSRNVLPACVGDKKMVDCTVRFHFVKTAMLWTVPWFKALFRDRSSEKDAEVLVEDDLLLHAAVQLESGHPSFAIGAELEGRSNLEELEHPHPHSGRPHHREFRDRFVKLAVANNLWRRTR